MQKLFQNHRVFWVGYLSFLLLALGLMIQDAPVEMHLWLNSFHHPVLDLFFKYITLLGDGITVTLVSVALLLYSMRWAFCVGLSGILAGLIAQFFKRVVFSEIYRPAYYFEKMETLQPHLIEGINLHQHHSFPSGHTSAAFAACTALALLSRGKSTDLLFLVLGVLIAYSRVYISQHFIADIAAGSVIGVSVAVLSWYLLVKKAAHVQWLDRGLFFKKTR